MKEKYLKYYQQQPNTELSEFVESYWMLENTTNEEKELVVLADGRIDVFFSKSLNDPFHTSLSGIENKS